MFIFAADYNEVDARCSIISTSLTTLSTAGGVITNGTQNVVIYCLCMRGHVVVPGARWFFPNYSQVRVPTFRGYISGSPYYFNVIPTPLIIPTFVHPYNGTYKCILGSGIFHNEQYGDNISLTITGIIRL